jgi:hypothetical protein
MKVFEVIDKDGQPKALFYCDYFRRPTKRGGAWMDGFQKQSRQWNQLPIIYNVCNSAKAPEGKAIKGWKVITTPASGSKQTKEYEGSEFALNLATCKSVAIEAILGEETGISTAAQILWQWKRTVGGVNVSNVPAGEKVSIYDLRGVLLSEAISNGSDIFLPAASGKLYILKVGSESVKIQ